ncbi:MAG TPA: thioesterase family protein [Candidatus Hydrogenedentes bacterium]|nr:thioesterase family protein [Candidatus Hydrogenedentota bacterium]
MAAAPEHRPLLVELRPLIQPYHIDYAMHVNNAVYVRWLEDLRMEFLRRHCDARALTEAGIAPVVSRTEISYLKPLRLFDEPEARMWCADMGRATMTLEAEITVGGETHTRALQRVMMVNWKTERAARVPEELRKAFAAAFPEGK